MIRPGLPVDTPIGLSMPLKPTLSADWSTTITPSTAPGAWVKGDTRGAAFVSNYGDQNWRGEMRALPGAPFDVVLGVAGTVQNFDYNGCWVIFRDSGTGNIYRLAVAEWGTAAFGTIRLEHASAAAWATAGADASLAEDLVKGCAPLVRFANDTTNYTWWVSFTGGLAWTKVFSVATGSAYCAPDQIGLSVLSNASAGVDAPTRLHAWHYDAAYVP